MKMGDISFELLATTCILTIYYTFSKQGKNAYKSK